MKKYRIIVIWFILGFTFSFCNAQDREQTTIAGKDSALLFRKEVRIVHSDIMDDNFRIEVSLPAVYYRSDTTFPVLFSTDANRNFGIISDLVNGLSFPINYIPYTVVVGIGYPINGLEEWGARRHNDLTPSYDSIRSENWYKNLKKISGRGDLNVKSGQADKFLLFIQQELIPFIEKEYKVSKANRGIAGFSLGGLFSIYAMLKSPETFKYYFAGSPSLWWDDEIILKNEKMYANNHDDLDVRLYMSVGEFESTDMIEGMKKMEEQLKSRNYLNLQRSVN